MKYTYLFLVIILGSCNSGKKEYRTKLSLVGTWEFALDPKNIGEQEKWYATTLNDQIYLPGTTDSNKKGFINKDTTTLHLNRAYKYEGAAWYRKKIIIPKNFNNKHIELFLERTKSSKIWIDSTFIGTSHLLQSPQKFDISGNLQPGEHYITLQINNNLKLTPYGNVHIYSDDTQTNWNGVIGNLFLEVSSKIYISNLQVTPDIDHKKIDIDLEINNQPNTKNIDIELVVQKTVNGKTITLKPQKFNIAYQQKLQLSYFFKEEVDLWDEFHQPIYNLQAIISNPNFKDAKKVSFGMRKFAVHGTQFSINGQTTFLRGKHEAAVFPLTGYTPMEVKDWIGVYKIAKSYGINHYRFHTYCPPEAAFTAADQEGIYIQAELPFWGGLENDKTADMLQKEGLAMLKSYANHPSFVMFSPGNEIWGGHDRVEKIMNIFKSTDSRPLYTMGSNNNIGYMEPRNYASFFVGARTPYNGNATIAHTRLTHAFADVNEGGILNTQTPNTNINYDVSISKLNIPIVSHEIGQYQMYPNYDEIDKYTGVLQARNLEKFKQSLQKSGMGTMDSIFQKASGAWAAICYKAEMEAALRTKNMAGFQLLDLQDFPGQGTALVGILDAFMDSKHVITTENWKQSCNDVVLLAEFPKYCYTNQENFTAQLKIANYGNKTIQNNIHWEIKNEQGTILYQESFLHQDIVHGKLSAIGNIDFDFHNSKKAEKLMLHISIKNTHYSNTYPIWVYPKNNNDITNNAVITDVLNTKLIHQLQNGAKVLLFPKTEDVQKNSVRGHFPPDFWNYGMFKTISENNKKPISPGTLGILTNPKHPIFNHFPTDFHTNWQWFSIIKASNSLILDSFQQEYRPIVQVIDTLERNHKLGLIFEFKIGQGKLLVCMSQLKNIIDKPEANQLYQSIIKYINSEDFNPETTISENKLKEILL